MRDTTVTFLTYSISFSQLHRLQSIQNAPARAVSRTPLHAPITPTLQSLYWLKIEQRIQYKVISIRYDVPHNTRSRGSTRSADCRCPYPPRTSTLKFSDLSFRNAASHLRKHLPPSLRSYSSSNALSSTAYSFPRLAISRLQFLFRLKTHLFTMSYQP